MDMIDIYFPQPSFFFFFLNDISTFWGIYFLMHILKTCKKRGGWKLVLHFSVPFTYTLYSLIYSIQLYLGFKWHFLNQFLIVPQCFYVSFKTTNKNLLFWIVAQPVPTANVLVFPRILA